MKLNPYIQKLSNSQEYKKFQKSNNDAFLIAGFFVLDLESGKSMHQIDYYIPSKKKVAAFTLDKTITMQMLGMLSHKAPEKLENKSEIDLDALEGILEDEMRNRNITDSIKKIIAVIQKVEGKKIWNLNCILSGMSVLNAHVEDESRSILKMEKKSLIDIMRNVPTNSLQKMQQGNQSPLSKMPQIQTDAQDGQGMAENSNVQQVNSQISPPQIQAIPQNNQDNIKEEIKKLNALEKAIKKEKAALQSSNSRKSSVKKKK